MEVSSLRIVLSANISEFEKSMHKIERDFANITKKAETFSKVGAVITGAFALAVKSLADAGDAAAKMSARTGLAVESVQELKYAADLSGTSIEGKSRAEFLNTIYWLQQTGHSVRSFLIAVNHLFVCPAGKCGG